MSERERERENERKNSELYVGGGLQRESPNVISGDIGSVYRGSSGVCILLPVATRGNSSGAAMLESVLLNNDAILLI